MSDPSTDIEQLGQSAREALRQVNNPGDLESFRITYLGTKGRLRELLKLLGTVPSADRPMLGQRINSIRDGIQSAYDEKREAIEAAASAGRDAVDVTEPGRLPTIGRPHLVMRVLDELKELFGRLGFEVAEGPELEDDWHNFVALNIPSSHPARDPNDNFYLVSSDGLPSNRLLRTQTSTVQVRVMETRKPPFRVVMPGRVYRPDTTDATHLPMFHQIEALVIDRSVTMVDLKSTILQFVRGYFGTDTRSRFRPSFFPFTEPSAEVDVYFPQQDRWIELGGCGMVHPKVLGNCGIDPEGFCGWAFGFGVERIAMRKYAIPDIRMLVENDVRFLRQF
jgi:phenylalanyl-tRNA synthetase alpha chain